MKSQSRKERAFTDDDLKRLKEDAERDKRIGLPSADRIIALLARLEAAEQVIVDCTCHDHEFFNDRGWRTEHLEAWRKASGK